MIKHLFVFLLLMTSCAPYTESPYLPYVRKVRSESIAYARAHAKVRVEGTGGRLFCGVGAIWIGFGSDETYDLEDARRHFMIIAQDLVNRIEVSDELQPYLKDPDHIENAASITLSYTNKRGNPQAKKPVALVSLINGTIFYRENGKNHPGFDLIHRESYSEALEILRQENS